MWFRKNKALVAATSVAVLIGGAGGMIAADGSSNTAGEPIDPSSLGSEPLTVAAVAPDGAKETFYPAFAFRPRGTASTTLTPDAGRGCVHGSDELLTTEVLLPDGATVDMITLYARPSAGSVSAFLSVFNTSNFPGSGPGLTDLFGAFTSGTGDQVVVDSTPTVPATAVVDNSNNNYVLQVFSDVAGEWFCGVKVTWTPPVGELFHPLPPCAIYDSRVSQGGTGKFGANETRTANVTGNTSGQGGGADCGVGTDATAIETSLLVLNPAGTGTLKIWATGSAEPNGILPFTGQLDRWPSAATVPVSSSDQIDIKTRSAGAHVRVVVTGYYAP